MRQLLVNGSSGVTEDVHPNILLCATMWWPLSARLAMAFLARGCTVRGVCPPGHPLRFISGMEKVYRYKGLSSLQSLRAAIVDANPDLIVPCDDGVVWQLHQLHASYPELRKLIERSLGDAAAFADIRGRGTFLQIASELGVRIPTTHIVATEAELEACLGDDPAVMKLDGTWGGSGVEIVRSREEARTAFRRFSRPKKALAAWKRLVINRDPLALWMWRERRSPSITVQQYVAGKPANCMIACCDGKVLGIVSVEVLTAQGATGAATVVRVVQHPEMERAARLIADRFKLNGFHGLDFVIDTSSGSAYLIELNPRSTQLGHLSFAGRDDLASAMTRTLTTLPLEPRHDAIRSETIAFFPQAITWNPKNPYLKCGYHDVPWEEPALFRDLLREAWPERQLPARIYHWFQKPKSQPEVRF